MLHLSGNHDFPSFVWSSVPEKCDDPFAIDRWNDESNLLQDQRNRSAFPFGGHRNELSVPQMTDMTTWSPQLSEDPLRGFRTSMQTGELKKLSSGLSHLSHHNRREGSQSSAESIDSLESESTSTTWSAIVQKNPRPVKNRRSKPSRSFTVTLQACCNTPKIKLVCSCCNEEAFIKVKEEMKPRLIPVSTSQLGFCRFCQTNGDPPEVYQSHTLRSDDGKVSCPVLREYNCPICNNGGGDFAHTIKYCPMARKAKPVH